MFPLRSFVAVAAVLGLAGIASAADELPGPIPATVVRVTDGDTLEVRRAPCPAHEDAGRAAKAFLEALSLSEVTLADVEHDKYGGRVAARVILPDGRDLSALLIETGHAWSYGEGDPFCTAPQADAGPAED